MAPDALTAVYSDDLDGFTRCLDLPGAEPTMVYIHGLAMASVPSFRHICAGQFLRDRRSLLIDLPGFGSSDRSTAFGYTIEDHAAAVITLLDHLAVRGGEVVGHSMGGSVAILIASARPDLVRRLVIAEGNLDPGAGSMTGPIAAQTEEEYLNSGYQHDAAALQASARSVDWSSPSVLRDMFQTSAAWAIHRSARSLIGPRQPTFREHLVALHMPRVFIVGSDTAGAMEQIASGEDGRALPPDVRRLIVPSAGHYMMFENPQGFTDAIVEASSV